MNYLRIALLGIALAGAAQAEGIVTYDPTNVVQSTISAQEAIRQTAQQLQQYQTQLQQLQNQLQNTANPNSFVWDNAKATINQVLATLDTLDRYKAQASSLDAYLNQFSNAGHYRDATCIGSGGCDTTQLQQLNTSQYAGSEVQKTANDNMLRNIEAQQQRLRDDANTLALLQQQAESSTGQMQALQVANQLASNQSAQLMQMRALFMAQQTAEAARASTILDREAKEQAAHDAFIGGAPTASQPYNVKNYTTGGTP